MQIGKKIREFVNDLPKNKNPENNSIKPALL